MKSIRTNPTRHAPEGDERIRTAVPALGADLAYDHHAHQWVGQCPHGDVCTGCDARGYCTREEGLDTPAAQREDIERLAARVEAAESEKRLVLEIEVPDFNVEGAQEAADEFCDGDLLFIVTEEWMRSDVGLTLVSLPGEKSRSTDFEVHTRVGRIVGAKIVEARDA